MSNSCFIFPHLPKCGGSSIRHQLAESGLKVYIDSDYPPHHKNKFMIDGCDRRNSEANILDFSNFDVVFGHFPINRYERESYKYITLMREPLDRAISHFHYWKYQLKETNALALSRNPIITDIKRGKIDFISFIEQAGVENFYQLYLANKAPDDFEFVGFTDEYDSFAKRLSELLGAEFDSQVRLRQREVDRENMNKRIIDKAKQLLRNEINYYLSYRKFWNA